MFKEIHPVHKSRLLQQLGNVRIDQSRFKIVRGLASIYVTLKPSLHDPHYVLFFLVLSKDLSFFSERFITVLE